MKSTIGSYLGLMSFAAIASESQYKDVEIETDKKLMISKINMYSNSKDQRD